MRNKTISVLGCGWLGLPLAQELVQLGYEVKGSTTTQEKLAFLQANGIAPFLLSFPENSSKTLLAEFLDSDILLFNLPPSRSSSATISYEQVLQTVLEALPRRMQAILFVSSTSVYPDLNREEKEEDALAAAEAPQLLLRCEHLVQQVPDTAATIVRFGGLMGGNRHPGRFLAGKTNVPQPEGPVNMIHLADCMALLKEIILQEKWGYTFNACAPEHPTRKEFYTTAAQKLNLTPPAFALHGEPKFKVINSDFIRQELSYAFLYPDPLTCLSSPAF